MITPQDKYTHWCANCEGAILKSRVTNRKHIDCGLDVVPIGTVKLELKDATYPDLPHLEVVKALVANESN